jgi:hypothetical protein
MHNIFVNHIHKTVTSSLVSTIFAPAMLDVVVLQLFWIRVIATMEQVPFLVLARTNGKAY